MEALKLHKDEDKFYNQIYQEFGKTKEDVDEYIDLILEWSKSQLHWPETPSINGIRFSIVANKFSIEIAKQKLDMYYNTLRPLMPEVFGRHPLEPELLQHSKVLYCIPLPKLTSKLHRVIYVQFNSDYNTEHFCHGNFISELTHVIEVLLQEDLAYNFEMVINCVGVKLGHVQRTNPMVLKKISVIIEKAYSNRVAAIYLCNMHYFVETFVNLLKQLLPKKIADRVKVLEHNEDLHNAVGKSILPKDVEGEEHSLAELQVMMTKKYEECKSRFDAIQFMTVDESKRPQKLKNDEILGYYGTFKKINLD